LTGEAYTIDNSPFITQGHYYVVSVGGTTSLNGVSNWTIGDWVIAGANNQWTKLDHSQVDGTGTTGNLTKWSSTSVIADSIVSESGSAITVDGSLTTNTNLSSTGNFTVNTDKFTVAASSGNTAFTGDLAINTDKFTVNATSGNTLVAGDLDVNGANADFAGEIDANGEIRSYYNGANYSRLLSTVDGGSVAGFNSSGGSFIIRDHSYSQIVSDGNLGLGITGQFAIQKVHIQGTGTTYMHIANDTTGSLSTDGADIGFLTGQTALQIINRENDSVIISTNDLPRVTIDGSGNSTFAGNVTADKLVVDGASNSNISQFALTRTDYSWGIFNETNLRFYVQSGNTTTPSTQVLELNTSGNATFAGNIILNNNTGELQSKDAAGTAARILTMDNADTLILGNPTTVDDIRFDVDTYGEGAMMIKSSGQILIGTDTPRGLTTIEQGNANTVGLVINSTSSSYSPKLYLRDQGGAGYSEIQANNDLYLNTTNVGIGTDDPDYKVDTLGTNQYALRLNTTDADGCFLTLQTNSVAKSYIGTSYHLLLGTQSADDTTIRAEGNLQFSAGGSTERMRIDSSGFVTIKNNPDTTNASLTLSNTDGTINIDQSIGYLNFYSNDNSTSSTGGVGGISVKAEEAFNTSFTPTYMSFYTHARTNNDGTSLGNVTERMRITSDGKIGIDEDSPLAKLTVNQDSLVDTEGIMVQSGNDPGNGGVAIFKSANLVGTISALGSQGELSFMTAGGNERMKITSTGQTIIDGSEAGTILSLTNRNAAPYGLSITFPSGTNTTNQYFIGCGDSGAGRFYVYANGNVVNSNNSYGAISDAKLKENIVDATPKLDDLMKVKVRNYNLIGDDKKQIGVVAQEIKNVFPSLVEDTKEPESEETTKSVKYSVLVPIMLKAIQELKAEVDSLKKECNCK